MNILVVICDQLRYDALACNGNPYVETPNLDRLAARSVQFSNAYTAAPVCSPARHSLITGLYPSAHGVLNNKIKPGPLVTIADKLQDRGYRTIQINAIPDKGEYGFESMPPLVMDDLLSAEDQQRVVWERTEPVRRRTGGPSTRTIEQHGGFLVAEKAVQVIERLAACGEKFHLWVGFSEPHPPFYPPRPFYEKFDQTGFKLAEQPPASAPAPHPSIVEKQQEWMLLTDAEKRQILAGYCGLVEMVDQFVGMVLDTVDRLKLADDTLIVFTSDHGEQMGEHGLYLKFVLRDPSIHVPLLFAHPRFAPGIRSELVSHVDLVPTLCDLVGADAPDRLHGLSLRPLLEGANPPENWRKDVISQIGTHSMIRTEEWKLNVYNGEPGELYHLSNDPKEFHNLIEDSRYAEVVDRLHKALEARVAQGR